MKPFRLLLIGAAALALLLVAVGLLAFNSAFQTWMARRALASRPELAATLGSLSAGLRHVEIKNLHLTSHGAMLTIPSLEAELPLVAAGLRKKIIITRLVAKGWTLDLSKVVKVAQAPEFSRVMGTSPAALPAEFSLLSSARAADPLPAAVVGQVFQGIFAQLALPVDLAVDGLDLEGELILPGARGHARVALAGGGLGSGREGRFELIMTASLTSTAVSTVETHSIVTATMDTPRSFTHLGLKAEATASGPKFPGGVKLSAATSAARTAAGEDYALSLATVDKKIVAVQASFPLAASKLAGTWMLDAHDIDVAPFTLGRALPPFSAAGEGLFDLDAALTVVHAVGKFNAKSESLAAIRPEFGAFGALQIDAEFDLTQNGDRILVERFKTSVSGAQPVATVESLQSLTYNRTTHGLKPTDPARELFAVNLPGLPLIWAQPFAKNFSVSGGNVHGEFAATATDGGFSLRPKAPLTATGLSFAQAGKPLLHEVDLTLNTSVDYSPHGWQVSAAPLVLRSGPATLLTLEAKIGQLAGKDQPMKAAGKFSASLPAWFAQPAAGGAAQLVSGEAQGEFAASIDGTQEIQAQLSFVNLTVDPKLTTEKLPAISADLRASIAPNGQITVNAPLLVEREGRKSDLVLVGTVTPDAKGLTVAARVSSNRLVLDDVKILAAPLAPPPAGTPRPTPIATRDAAPPWSRVSGQIALALKEVVYSGTFRATDVVGTLRVDAGALKFEGVHAGLGDGGDAKFSGAVMFDPKAPAPYSLNADLAVTDFNPAPVFMALNPGQPATVEGKFNVSSKLTGQAARLGDFATAAHGDFQLSSKGGIFRGLPVNVAAKIEAVGKLASGAALLGNLAGAVTGRKDYADLGTRAQALAEVAKIWQTVTYDQLSVVLTRDAALNTVLKDLTLISPELRLTGGGEAKHVAGRPLLEETLAMEFKLRARGRHGELLKYLGALESTADELGYSACTLPIKIGGTLGQPDTGELNNALAGLAFEKSGVKDKASDLLNKLFGK